MANKTKKAYKKQPQRIALADVVALLREAGLHIEPTMPVKNAGAKVGSTKHGDIARVLAAKNAQIPDAENRWSYAGTNGKYVVLKNAKGHRAPFAWTASGKLARSKLHSVDAKGRLVIKASAR
jgi:CHASE2 domain-containing sensor protein